MRLDVFLAGKLSGVSRSGIKKLLEEGRVFLNGKATKPGQKLKDGDSVSVSVPAEKPLTITPEEIPLEILYEDNDVIVINKPAGISAHPGAGVDSGTLVNALAFHTKDLSKVGGELRPGIVHRLDKDTTGVLVIAKNDLSHESLSKQFREHTTGRRYVALVWGGVEKEEGVIDIPIGRDVTQRKKISTRTKKSRAAVTHYKVLKRYPMMTLVELTPKTGRTHQLRVHLSAINHPVVGDPVYGKRKIPSHLPKEVIDELKRVNRQFLHAKSLGFINPGKAEYMEFSAPLPPDMDSFIKLLERTYGE